MTIIPLTSAERYRLAQLQEWFPRATSSEVALQMAVRAEANFKRSGAPIYKYDQDRLELLAELLERNKQ